MQKSTRAHHDMRPTGMEWCRGAFQVEFMPKFSPTAIWERWQSGHSDSADRTAISVFSAVSRPPVPGARWQWLLCSTTQHSLVM